MNDSRRRWAVKSHNTFHRRPSSILCRRQTKYVHGQECAYRSHLSDKTIHRCYVLWQSIGFIILPCTMWCAIADAVEMNYSVLSFQHRKDRKDMTMIFAQSYHSEAASP
ncbi:hypothetical protein BDR06DRAFT_98842 [Suillus hirtellus]|nr:hypothetical protein BDR06DRAFT_98842 [Suillus hirtellus]